MANICNVISWKFNDQPGMRCEQDAAGVFRIVQFPGGIPSQSDQDVWTSEYETYLASGLAVTNDAVLRLNGDRMLRALMETLFSMENRIRILESQSVVTRAAFRTALINTYRSIT